MAATDDNPNGASKYLSNRVAKFRMPERTRRPSDDAYFDHVLSAVEHDDTKASPQTADEITEEIASESLTDNFPSAAVKPISFVQAEGAIAGVQKEQIHQSPSMPPSRIVDKKAVPSHRVAATASDDAERRVPTTPNESITSLSASTELPVFVEFKRRWNLFLTETHLKLCEVIFTNTVAQGRDNYETTASSLCQAVNKSRRHTFLLLQQLEKMGFVTRKEIKENNRLLGIRIWFHISPAQQ